MKVVDLANMTGCLALFSRASFQLSGASTAPTFRKFLLGRHFKTASLNLSSALYRKCNSHMLSDLIYFDVPPLQVPRLREPRQLYGFNSNEMGPQQAARW